MGTTSMSTSELKKFIREGKFSDASIKKYIEEGRLSRKELVDEGVLTEDRLRKIFFVSPEEYKRNVEEGNYTLGEVRELVAKGDLQKDDLIHFHKRNIRQGRYSDNEIKDIIVQGEIDSYNLINEGVLTQEHLDDIFDRPLPLLDIGFDSWDQIPQLMSNRVDVFVLGIVGSGKSAFMAGLLYYARKNGKLGAEIDNTAGYMYVNAITDAVKRSILPPRTPDEKMQYMACSFTSPNDDLIPMTFIEMSGEVFQKCYGKKTTEMPQKFVQYMDHENNKVIMLAVDYKVHSSFSHNNTSQETQFDYIIKFLDKQGTLNNTEAICILITKWDLSPDQSEEAAIRFLEEEYLGLYNLCKQMEKKYKLRFAIFRYSLGVFGRRNSYTYDPKDSKLLYNWLCSFMPVQKQQGGRGIFGKLFGK